MPGLLMSTSAMGSNKMIRVRLNFEIPPPNHLSMSTKYMFLINNNELRSIIDLEHAIVKRFGFSNTRFMVLSIDGFTLLSNEDIGVIKEDDEIFVSYDNMLEQETLVSTKPKDVENVEPISGKKRKRKASKVSVVSNKAKRKNCDEPLEKTAKLRKITKPFKKRMRTNCSDSEPKTLTKKNKKIKSSTKQDKSSSSDSEPKTFTKKTKKVKSSAKKSAAGSKSSDTDSDSSCESKTVKVNKVSNSTVLKATAKSSSSCETGSDSSSSIASSKQTDSKVVSTAEEKKINNDSSDSIESSSESSESQDDAKPTSTVNGTRLTIPHEHDKKYSEVDAFSQRSSVNRYHDNYHNSSIILKCPADEIEEMQCNDDAAIPSTVPEVSASKFKQLCSDYDVLQTLSWPPRQGDIMAFKVMEMAENYAPVVSDYKEAKVLATSSVSGVKCVTIEQLWPEVKPPPTAYGRFELNYEDEEEIEPEVDVVITLQWTLLMDTKLIEV